MSDNKKSTATSKSGKKKQVPNTGEKMVDIIKQMGLSVTQKQMNTREKDFPANFAALQLATSTFLPSFSKNTPMRNMYLVDSEEKCVRHAYDTDHHSIRILDTNFKDDLEKRDVLQKLAVTEEEKAIEEPDALRYALFEAKTIKRRTDTITKCNVSSVFICNHKTKECLPVHTPQGKELFGPVIIIKSDNARGQITSVEDVCNNLWKSRETIVSLLEDPNNTGGIVIDKDVKKKKKKEDESSDSSSSKEEDESSVSGSTSESESGDEDSSSSESSTDKKSRKKKQKSKSKSGKSKGSKKSKKEKSKGKSGKREKKEKKDKKDRKDKEKKAKNSKKDKSDKSDKKRKPEEKSAPIKKKTKKETPVEMEAPKIEPKVEQQQEKEDMIIEKMDPPKLEHLDDLDDLDDLGNMSITGVTSVVSNTPPMHATTTKPLVNKTRAELIKWYQEEKLIRGKYQK